MDLLLRKEVKLQRRLKLISKMSKIIKSLLKSKSNILKPKRKNKSMRRK